MNGSSEMNGSGHGPSPRERRTSLVLGINEDFRVNTLARRASELSVKAVQDTELFIWGRTALFAAKMYFLRKLNICQHFPMLLNFRGIVLDCIEANFRE